MNESDEFLPTLEHTSIHSAFICSITNATRCNFCFRTLPLVFWLAIVFDAMHSNSSTNTIPSLKSYRMSVIVFDLGINWKLIHRKNVRASCWTLFCFWSIRSFSEVITLDLKATEHYKIYSDREKKPATTTTKKLQINQSKQMLFYAKMFCSDSNYDFSRLTFRFTLFFPLLCS